MGNAATVLRCAGPEGIPGSGADPPRSVAGVGAGQHRSAAGAAVSEGTPVDELAAELETVYAAAGRPPFASLAKQCRAQRPPINLVDATWSGWLHGRAVPMDRRTLVVLAKHLQGVAVAKNAGRPPDERYRPRSESFWSDLHRRAQEHQRLRRGPAPAGLGRPVGGLADSDADIFGVHPSVYEGDRPEGGALPGYLLRPHDVALRAELGYAEQGTSRVVVLVGQSSTGKTRSCWEAMRAVLPDWTVWHPLVPTRPRALLEALTGDRIRPRTVLWLDEMYLYLADGPDGEHAAVALHELVHGNRSGGPLLVLGSMWSRHIDELNRPPAADHASARLLLRAARIIDVPPEFSPRELAALHARAVADPQLRLAARQAGTSVCQFLAGAPQLRARYERGDATTRAVIWAAMDARRLGHGEALPEELLRQASRAYLDAHQWDPDGFERAMQLLTEPCLGVPGPLAPAGKGPEDPRFRLADVLDQLGRTERGDRYPPAGFWDAVAHTVTEPADQIALARAARSRGRRQRAVQLVGAAATHGGSAALTTVADRIADRGNAADTEFAELLYRLAADRGDADALAGLAALRNGSNRPEEARRLWAEAAERGSARALAYLADQRRWAGDLPGAVELYQQAADRGSIDALGGLGELREKAGDVEGAERLYRELAAHGFPGHLGGLAVWWDRHGDPDRAERLLAEFGAPTTWRRTMADRRLAAGDRAGAEKVLLAAADRPDGESALHDLAELRTAAGDPAGAEAAYRRAMIRGDRFATRQVARLRSDAGDHHEAIRLLTGLLADSGRFGWEGQVTELLRDLASERTAIGDAAGAYRAACAQADHGSMLALAVLGWRADEAGDHERALRLFRVAVDHGYGDAFVGLMTVAGRASGQQLAERVWRESKHRSHLGHLMDRAMQQRDSGDRNAAIELLRRAADGGHAYARQYLAGYARRPIDSTDPRLYPTAGHSDTAESVSDVWFREIAGDRAGAEAAAREAAALGNHLGLLNLAWLRTDAGESGEAYLQEAVDGGNVFALERLAESRSRAGDHPAAIALYRRAAADGYVFAWGALAGLYETTGDRAAAEEAARQAAVLGDAEALSTLACARERAGLLADAVRLVRQAVDSGTSWALADLGKLLGRTEGNDVAQRLYRHGLDDHGDVVREPALSR